MGLASFIMISCCVDFVRPVASSPGVRIDVVSRGEIDDRIPLTSGGTPLQCLPSVLAVSQPHPSVIAVPTGRYRNQLSDTRLTW